MTCNRESGFSLVEVIVSLTLFSLILVMLPGALRTGQRGWQSAAEVQQRELSEASFDYLRQRLIETAAVFETEASGLRSLAFKGEPQGLRFVAPVPAGPAGGGLYRIAVRLENSVVILEMTPFRSETPPNGGAVVYSRTLMSKVAGFRVRYFTRNSTTGKATWSDSWTDTRTLPDMIEVEGPSQISSERGHYLRVDLKLRAVN